MPLPACNDQITLYRPPPLTGAQTWTPTSTRLGKVLDEGGTAVVHLADNGASVVKFITYAFNASDRRAIFMKWKRQAQFNSQFNRAIGCAVFTDRLIFERNAPAPDTLIGCSMRFVPNALPLLALARHPDDLHTCKILPNATIDTLRTIAFNTATAFGAMHTNGFCLGDPNANNILVNKTTLGVTFIDPDSYVMPITENGRGGLKTTHYPPAGTTPGFRSPRIIDILNRGGTLQDYVQSDDNYVLAIHIFRLLVAGFHPFHLNLANAEVAETAMVRRDYPFAAGRQRPRSFAGDIYEQLPAGFRAAFHYAFARVDPPTPSVWRELFTQHWGHLCQRPAP